jgi:beta-barrel assembly-enhancing protease
VAKLIFQVGVLFSSAILAATARDYVIAEQRPPFTFTQIDLELHAKAGQTDRDFEDKGLVLDDPRTTAYVTSVATAVLPSGPPPERVEWRFRVLRDPIANAFALPNGSVYINSGLLVVLENEAQLASVLAHEETHVLNRHGYFENRSRRKKVLAAHIFSVTGAVIGTIVPALLEASIHGYAKNLEREADLRSVEALNNAGYSTEEIPNTFRLLRSSHEVELNKNFYQDHPSLEERIRYMTAQVNEKPATKHAKVGALEYAAATESVARHNISLDILAGRARTATAVALRLVTQDPGSSENYRCLGDAFRALGPRTQEPTPEELSSKGKKEERKKAEKMTREEREKALVSTAEGPARWEVNRKKAEEAYSQAVDLKPENAAAHRGLGFLYEDMGLAGQSSKEFKRYLELSPEASDRLRIDQHIAALENRKGQPSATPSPR